MMNHSLKHLAVIMDGNGRWAKKRSLPRVYGHIKGVKAVKQLVKQCIEQGIRHLSLFAFSSENWRRPSDEVSFLMKLLGHTLKKEQARLKTEGVFLNIIGDISALNENIQQLIDHTKANQPEQVKLYLNVAINYGGQWDIMQAISQCQLNHPNQTITQAMLSQYLCLNTQPEPDLLIRTGGEKRISNFLIWQMAYTELYFTDCYWPEFDEVQLNLAIQNFTQRERRFGHTSEQIQQSLT